MCTRICLYMHPHNVHLHTQTGVRMCTHTHTRKEREGAQEFNIQTNPQIKLVFVQERKKLIGLDRGWSSYSQVSDGAG